MQKLANRPADILSQISHPAYIIFRLNAIIGFLALLVLPAQADVSGRLKSTLLEKAIAENLVCRSASFSDISESKPSALNPRQRISSVNASLRLLFVLPIRLHREVITHQDGDVCSFHPSCSRYGLAAIRRYGLKGLLMASDRLLRCHGGSYKYYLVFEGFAYDPVP